MTNLTKSDLHIDDNGMPLRSARRCKHDDGKLAPNAALDEAIRLHADRYTSKRIQHGALINTPCTMRGPVNDKKQNTKQMSTLDVLLSNVYGMGLWAGGMG